MKLFSGSYRRILRKIRRYAEYYVQQMVVMNFSGTTVVPSGFPYRMSVYASYDEKKVSTALLAVNKNKIERVLTLEIDSLKTRIITFSPMSINIATIPDK